MAQRWKVFAIVSVGVFAASLDLFIVNIAFPDIGRDFPGADLAGMSWVLNAYTIAIAALLVPAGRIADRVGRKRAFLGGLGLFTLASGLAALAPSVEWLVAARVAQAAGAAFLLPTSLGLMLAEFPPERRASAVGAWGAISGVAAGLGPPLGGVLVEASWRWVFIVNVPAGLAAIVVGARVLRESREPAGARLPDLLGAAFVAAGIALLAAAIVKGEDWGWGAAQTVGAFGASALFVAAAVARSARHPAPVVELSILRERSFAVANLASLLFFAAFGSMVLTGVLFLTGAWGWSTLHAGLALAPGPLTAAAFAGPAGRLADRIDHRALIVPGALLFAASFVWLIWQAGPTPSYAEEFLPAMLVGGAGVGMTLPVLAASAAASLPPERFATGTGIISMTRQIGTAIGVAIVVAILAAADVADPLGAYRTAWAFMALTGLGAAGTAIALGRVRVLAPARTPAPAVAGPS